MKQITEIIVKYLSAFLILILGKTYRYRILGKEHNDRAIYAFWHRNLFPLVYLRRNENVGVIISESKDGDFISNPIELLGYQTARGSSTRGGSKAVRELIRISRKNSLAITPDGPRGPREKLKDGLTYTAYMTKLPIILVAVDVKNEWVFNSWDSFRVPKPFSKILISYSQPYFVENKEDIANKKKFLQIEMDNLTKNTVLKKRNSR